MECNKDEAAKAKALAEKKLTERDIAGAKKFALKAQTLFPGLEGLPQFMGTVDVYISAEKKICGEIDWYGVLGVDPWADDEKLRRNYRKLALTLHPDKNKSVGAEGAFKIISEAWSLLSDKARRVAYNQRRNLKGMDQINKTGNTSTPAGKNGFHTFTNNNHTSVKDQKIRATPQPTPIPPRPSKPNSFWTACNRCKMQYEYLRDYLNQNLCCPSCKQPFYAVEMPAPPSHSQNPSTLWSSYQQWQNVNHNKANNMSASGGKPTSASTAGTPGFAGVGSINTPNIQQGSFSGPGGVRTVPASAGHNAYAYHPTCQNLKRGHEEAARRSSASKKMGARLGSNAGSSSGKGERPAKKSRIEVNVTGRDAPNQMATGNGGVCQGNVSGYQKGSFGTERLRTSGTVKHNNARVLSQFEIRNLLMAKSRMEIKTKLNEWNKEAALKASNKEGNKMEMEKPKAAINGGKKDGNKNAAFVDTKNSSLPKKSSADISIVNPDENPAEVMLMSVPDPDFHDFDKDRVEKSFGENQVWAAYDDDDGMPRYYAMIHGVISKRPFKMRISWLNSKSNAELGPLNWVGSGFPKTSGDFWIGKHEVSNKLNTFSHKVQWKKGTRGVIQIFPRKGDVWALYRNWSPNWNELTPDEVIHKYDMVEVLEDYSEERGVVVAPLVKVAGFKSVFHQHLNPGEVKTIPKEEIFCLSHQVPSYMLTGEEARNAPQGCRELDPAALPLELLQVITETEEVETVDKSEKPTKEDAVEGEGKVKEDLHLEKSGKSTAQERMFKIVYTRNAKKGKVEKTVKNINEAKE